MRASGTQVLVCSIGKDMIKQRLSICNRLWKAGLNVSKNKKSTIRFTNLCPLIGGIFIRRQSQASKSTDLRPLKFDTYHDLDWLRLS